MCRTRALAPVLLGCVGTGAIRRTLLTRYPAFHSSPAPDILWQRVARYGAIAAMYGSVPVTDGED
jgi:hypothetical protein